MRLCKTHLASLLCLLLPVTLIAQGGKDKDKEVSPVLDFTMKTIDGEDRYLGDYQGDVLLVVNVASKCGYTPQYKELQALYLKYKDQGLRLLAFPANNFGGQEPGSDAQIKAFCRSNYDVTFDMFSKVSVKGDEQCDFYKFLTDKEKTGRFGGDIRWNFQKFLIDRRGQVVARFEPADNPLGKKVIQALESALAEKPAQEPEGQN